MQKQMPEWLKKHYNTLWNQHKNEAFTFKDVKRELGISRSMTIKTLRELEQRGFVNKERSDIDYRTRTYRLISPEDIKFVIGLYSLTEKEKIRKQTLMEKFVFIDEKLPYVITGSHAAYHYHRYMNPPKVVEVKIEPKDEAKWIAFLTDEKTSVFLRHVIETRKVSNYVKLLHSTRPIKNIRKRTEQGYYIEKPEPLVIELLQRQSHVSTIEAIAIIALNKNKMEWSGPNGIINLARSSGILRRFGLILDTMNIEAQEHLIDPEMIKNMKKDVAGKSDKIFPRDEIFLSRFRELRNRLVHKTLLTKKEIEELESAKERFEGYRELGEKWGIQVILPRDVVRKVLEDLGVKLGKK